MEDGKRTKSILDFQQSAKAVGLSVGVRVFFQSFSKIFGFRIVQVIETFCRWIYMLSKTSIVKNDGGKTNNCGCKRKIAESTLWHLETMIIFWNCPTLSCPLECNNLTSTERLQR